MGEGKERQKAVRVGRNVICSQFVLHRWPKGRRCLSGERRVGQQKQEKSPLNEPAQTWPDGAEKPARVGPLSIPMGSRHRRLWGIGYHRLMGYTI